MKLNIIELPSIKDFVQQDEVITAVPENSEGYDEAVEGITSVVFSVSDSGMGSSDSGGSVTISGVYRDQFNMAMGYVEPQIERDVSGDPLRDSEGNPINNTKLPLVQHEVSSWGDVPTPEMTEDIWYLYKFTPPGETRTSVTITVSGTMTTTDTPIAPAVGDPVVTTGVPWSGSVTQEVLWDIDTNIAEFRRYYAASS